MPTSHVPVLLPEALSQLNLRPGDNVVDATIGGAGHAEAILEATSPNGHLLGLDLDPAAVERAADRLARFGDRGDVVQGDFANLDQLVRNHPAVEPVRGVFLDLGLSSDLLADPQRGFTFQEDGPLDMRFDLTRGQTAAQFLNRETAESITRALKAYGEERFAIPIAEAVVAARRTQPLATTGKLAEIVVKVYREKLHSRALVPWVGGRHPATKTFQAIRIAINDEYGKIERGLAAAIKVLAPYGRLVVISFHSGEDRLVKQTFRRQAAEGRIKILTKKPLIASAAERRENPRSRSAKLRSVERTDQP